MRRKLIIKLSAALILVIALLCTSYIAWFLKEKKPVDILVMNKSAVSGNRVEHRAAFWVLNKERFVNSSGKAYRQKSGYYGFIPLSPFRNREYLLREITEELADSLSKAYDVAWYVDTYGVSLEEWYSGTATGVSSRMLYGGLDYGDYLFIKKMLESNKMVIAEFNFFASPTPQDIRSMVEQLTGVYWSGWSGSYYDNLDYSQNGEFPLRLVENYEGLNGALWDYSGPGIVFESHDNKVVVLEYDTHLDVEVPLVTTSGTTAAKYGVAETVHYPGRFDISYPADTSAVVSYYEIYVNSNGEKVLSKHNIPCRFPAVTVAAVPGTFLYMAGDYSNIRLPLVTSRLAGSQAFDFLLYSNDVVSKESFFSKYYYPFVSKIIKDYQSELTKK